MDQRVGNRCMCQHTCVQVCVWLDFGKGSALKDNNEVEENENLMMGVQQVGLVPLLAYEIQTFLRPVGAEPVIRFTRTLYTN